MILIKPSVEIIKQEAGLDGIYKHIEKCGKVCYQSSCNITEDSAKPFVKRLVESHHFAPLEHSTVYIDIAEKCKDFNSGFVGAVCFFLRNKYSNVFAESSNLKEGPTRWYITTNCRVIEENPETKVLLKYMCSPTKHKRRITARFICDRAIAQEFTRHRKFSFCMESSRFCNYSKSKFGKSITFVIPPWLNIPEGSVYWHDGIGFRMGVDEANPEDYMSVRTSDALPGEEAIAIDTFLSTLKCSEDHYGELLKQGWKAEQARNILPLATKTELIMTGFIDDWKDFFNQRCSFLAKTGKPHPQASELADKLYDLFVTEKYIENER